jgi:hypothetical protein
MQTTSWRPLTPCVWVRAPRLCFPALAPRLATILWTNTASTANTHIVRTLRALRALRTLQIVAKPPRVWFMCVSLCRQWPVPPREPGLPPRSPVPHLGGAVGPNPWKCRVSVLWSGCVVCLRCPRMSCVTIRLECLHLRLSSLSHHTRPASVAHASPFTCRVVSYT